MMKRKNYIPVILFTGLLTGLPFLPLSAQDSLLGNLSASDSERAETGILTIQEVQKRYWSGIGTDMGSMGLLADTLHTYAFISNPTIRKQLTAEALLYMGRVSKKEGNRALAQDYYKSAMNQAQESINFHPTSKAYRILAEAAYEEKRSRILPKSRKYNLFIKSSLDVALRLNSKNLEALLMDVWINKTQSSINGLLNIEKERVLSQTEQFRLHATLSKAYNSLKNKKEASRRKRKAFSIFPESRFLPRGKMADAEL